MNSFHRSTLFRILVCAILFELACAAQEPLKLSEAQSIKAAVTRVDPEYPIMAKQMKLSGRVVVEALVDTSGGVEKVSVVSGNTVLASGATAALKKWKFTPFTAEGKPCKALARLKFDFNLNTN